MKKIITALLCMVLLITISQPIWAQQVMHAYYMEYFIVPEEPVLSNSVVLVDVETETLAYQKNEIQQLDPGALVKIMTAALVFYYVPADELDTKIICDEDIMNNPKWYELGGTLSELVAGEEVSIRDLLVTMMVQSANDTSEVLARYVGKAYLGGDETTFITRMNQFAEELGCTNTNFVNVHGLSQEGQYSTASDMAKIALYAISFPEFLEISGPNYYEIEPTNKHTYPISIYSSNLMSSALSSYYYPPATNIRIGRTPEGMEHLASVATYGSRTYLLIALNAPYLDEEEKRTYATYKDAEMLFDWAFADLQLKSIVTQGDVYTAAEIPVALSTTKDYVLAVPESDIALLLPRDWDIETLDLVRNIPAEIQAPIVVGQVLGSIDVKYNEVLLASVDLQATEALERSPAKSVANDILIFLFSTPVKIVSGLLIVGVILFVLYTINHNKKRSAARARKKRKIEK